MRNFTCCFYRDQPQAQLVQLQLAQSQAELGSQAKVALAEQQLEFEKVLLAKDKETLEVGALPPTKSMFAICGGQACWNIFVQFVEYECHSVESARHQSIYVCLPFAPSSPLAHALTICSPQPPPPPPPPP